MESWETAAVRLLRRECGAQATLGVIGHRWSPMILEALSLRPMRCAELRGAIPEVSKKVLTETLRRLERDGLVVRRLAAHDAPTRYALTELGVEAGSLLSTISRWGEEHLPSVERARRHHDAAA